MKKNYWTSQNVISKPKNFKWIRNDEFGQIYSYLIGVYIVDFVNIDYVEIEIRQIWKTKNIDTEYTEKYFFNKYGTEIKSYVTGCFKRDGDYFDCIKHIHVPNNKDLYFLNKNKKLRVSKLNNIFTDEK